jgi:hypothetical protein
VKVISVLLLLSSAVATKQVAAIAKITESTRVTRIEISFLQILLAARPPIGELPKAVSLV